MGWKWNLIDGIILIAFEKSDRCRHRNRFKRKGALGQVMGAMSMGLAFAGRETFYFDELERVLNPQLRTYRPFRYGENPEYFVEFVETP